MDKVNVCIINYNGASFLTRCIDSVTKQDYENVEIMVVDNASIDDSSEVLEKYRDKIRLILNETNEGFCSAANKAIAASDGTYFLLMNPDVMLRSDFISFALKAFKEDKRIGAVSGKLLRYDEVSGAATNIIDSTGIVLNRMVFRAYDRGSGEKDTKQFDNKAEIFGVCGAAALYRREFLEDIKYNENEYFDELFFAYKEDVDAAWRGHKRGWRFLYAPEAVGYHVRGFQSIKRKEMPKNVRYHSFKNRYIMLLKNLTPLDFIKSAIFIIPYEILLFTYVLLIDRTLFKSYLFVLKNLKRIVGKR